MSAGAERSDNVLRLRSRATSTQRWASRTAGDVRRHLSLLQGYADLMEGMSAEQRVQILRVMAEKIKELTTSLGPLIQTDLATRNIDDYRQTRLRSRQLLADYRRLLDSLNAILTQAHISVPDQYPKPRVG